MKSIFVVFVVLKLASCISPSDVTILKNAITKAKVDAVKFQGFGQFLQRRNGQDNAQVMAAHNYFFARFDALMQSTDPDNTLTTVANIRNLFAQTQSLTNILDSQGTKAEWIYGYLLPNYFYNIIFALSTAARNLNSTIPVIAPASMVIPGPLPASQATLPFSNAYAQAYSAASALNLDSAQTKAYLAQYQNEIAGIFQWVMSSLATEITNYFTLIDSFTVSYTVPAIADATNQVITIFQTLVRNGVSSGELFFQIGNNMFNGQMGIFSRIQSP